METRLRTARVRSATWAGAIAVALTMAGAGVPARAADVNLGTAHGTWAFNDQHYDVNGSSPIACNQANVLRVNVAPDVGPGQMPASGAWSMAGTGTLAGAAYPLDSGSWNMCGWYEPATDLSGCGANGTDPTFMRGYGGFGWVRDGSGDALWLYDIGWESADTVMVVEGHYQMYSDVPSGNPTQGTPQPHWGKFTMTMQRTGLLRCNPKYDGVSATVVFTELPEAP